MELEKLFGLPAHPLLVHMPVVLIPLSGLIAIVFAFKTAWLDRFGWGLVVLSGDVVGPVLPSKRTLLSGLLEGWHGRTLGQIVEFEEDVRCT